MTKKNYITILSIIASLGVVLLHTNECFWSFSYERYWITANIIESVFYFSAPVFFMITGATLIDYRSKYSTKVFFKKRFAKTLVPFLFWSLCFIVFSVILGWYGFSDLTVTGLINGIFNTKYLGIYWFFISLFTVYLSIPVIGATAKENRRSVFKYIIITSIIFNELLPLIFSLTNGKLIYNSGLNMPFGLHFLIYPIMGYYIDKYELSRRTKAIIYSLAVLSLGLILFGTLYLSFDAGKIVTTFKEYNNFPCVAYSAAIFLFFKDMKFEKLPSAIQKIIDFIAPSTFGIYLLHYFFIAALTSSGLVNTKSIVYRVGGGIMIYIICIFITRGIQKIPFLKRLIP